MTGAPDLPPVWLVGFLAVAWALAEVVPLATFGGPVATAIGGLIALAGVGLIGWAGRQFLRAGTTIEPHEAPTVLITSGPFRLSRNPIYLGLIAILAGVVVALGGLSGLVLPPLFGLVLSRRFVVREEQALLAQFGDAARRYVAATRRWV